MSAAMARTVLGCAGLRQRSSRPIVSRAIPERAALRAAVQNDTLAVTLALKLTHYPAVVQDRLASLLTLTGQLNEDDIVAAVCTECAAPQLLPLEPPTGSSAKTSSHPDEPEDTADSAAEQAVVELVYEPVEDRPPDGWWLTD
jgi:hypothetical protein